MIESNSRPFQQMGYTRDVRPFLGKDHSKHFQLLKGPRATCGPPNSFFVALKYVGPLEKKCKTAFDKQTTQTHRMLFVLIFAISFLANTISVEMFQVLEFTCSVHYIFFWQSFFIFNINSMSRKKRKAKDRAEPKIVED